MSDQLSIPAGSLRTVWVFSLDLPEDAAADFADPPAGVPVGETPAARALGLDRVDHDQIDVVRTSDIAGFGLSRYLIEAHGMDADSVAPDRERLDAAQGTVLLVFAQALPSSASRIDPRPPLRLLGRYTESLDFKLRPAPKSAAAAGPVAPNGRTGASEAAISGRVASLALLVLFLLVGIMVWVAA